jgi:hypothetical protein
MLVSPALCIFKPKRGETGHVECTSCAAVETKKRNHDCWYALAQSCYGESSGMADWFQ